jgi:hypothetical protein
MKQAILPSLISIEAALHGRVDGLLRWYNSLCEGGRGGERRALPCDGAGHHACGGDGRSGANQAAAKGLPRAWAVERAMPWRGVAWRPGITALASVGAGRCWE